MREELQVALRYEAEDLRDAVRAMPRGAIFRAFGGLFAGLAVIGLGVVTWWGLEWVGVLAQAGGDRGVWEDAGFDLALCSLPTVAIGGLIGFMLWNSWKQSNGKMLAQLKSDDTRVLGIGEAGISQRARYSESHYAWSCVRGFKEQGGILAIQLLDDSMLLVPKRGLAGETITRIRELVSGNSGRGGEPGGLMHDAGEVFWEGETTYTRQDVEAGTNVTNAKPGAAADQQAPGKQPPQKFSRAMLGWVLILVAAVVMFVLLHDTPAGPAPVKAEDHHLIARFWIPALLLVAWLVAWGRLLQNAEWRRRREDAVRPRRFMIGEGGIVMVHWGVRQWLSWGAIADVVESGERLILVGVDGWRIVVPARVMKAEMMRSLAEYARGRMGGKAQGFEVIGAG